MLTTTFQSSMSHLRIVAAQRGFPVAAPVPRSPASLQADLCRLNISAFPCHVQNVGLLRVLVAELALVGVVHGVANGARHAHRGRRDQDVVALLIDGHDAPQGMFLFFALLDVSCEMQDFVAVLFLERPTQRQMASRISARQAMPCGTVRFPRLRRSRQPLPAHLVKHRAAFGADRGLAQLALGLVGIVLVFLDVPVAAYVAGACADFSGGGSHDGIPFVVVADSVTMLRVAGTCFDAGQSLRHGRKYLREITGMNQRESQRRLAEAVRDACRKAAQEAYENAGISGLCEEGRWECAVSALRSLDLEAVIDAMQDDPQK